MTAPVFVAFLRRLTHNEDRPVYLIVDNHSTHRSRLVKDFVAETSGRLRLFHLPSYSRELNQDQWVRRHVKQHRMGRKVNTGPVGFRHQVLASLHRLLKLPSVSRSFFYDPDIRYAF